MTESLSIATLTRSLAPHHRRRFLPTTMTRRRLLSGHVRISAMLPGSHRVRAKLAGGRVAEYWYAWRGGPRILAAVASNPATLQREIAKLAPAASRAYDECRTPKTESLTFYGLVTRYLAALETDSVLSDRTKRDRRAYLDAARADLGTMEIRAFESRRARRLLIDWRDSYAHVPKTADGRLEAVSAVLSWAVERDELTANPVKEFKRIYKVNRAEVIWEPQHMATLLAHADPDFALAAQLAGLTALREADLIRVPWSAVGEDAIIWQTGKSRGRRTVVIPITSPLRALLRAIPRKDAVTILTSSRGRPWTASGLAAGLRRARLAAKAHAVKTRGEDATSGIEGLRFHDLRGTAATNFLLNGLDLSQVALILGWKLERVREIAARYVSGQAMGLAMVKQLGRNAAKTDRVKGRVK